MLSQIQVVVLLQSHLLLIFVFKQLPSYNVVKIGKKRGFFFSLKGRRREGAQEITSNLVH